MTRSKAVLATVVATMLVALVGSGMAYASMSKTVTLSVDGRATQVRTFGGTVEDVLDSQGIAVGDHDIVAPAPETTIGEDDLIAVRFGRPLKVNLDGEKQTHWVTATNVASALDQIGMRLADADLSVSRSATIGRQGLTLAAATPKAIKVSIGGKRFHDKNLPVLTVRDLIRTMDVKGVDANDEIKPGLDHVLADGDKVVLTRVKVVKKRDRHVGLDYRTVSRPAPRLYQGDSKTVRSGHEGTKDVTYRLRYENGRLVRTRVLRSVVTDQPVNAVVAYGTKEKPAPEPAPAPTTDYSSGSTVWDQIAACESGGNWAINTGNGYYGGLQFDLSTWQSYGGSGLPSENSRETQIAIAEKVRAATGGYGSWPACSQSLGLPQ